MTAAQIRTAAALVEEADLPNDAIVTLLELGSEGVVFQTGSFLERNARTMIDRDGRYRTFGEGV